MLGINSSIEMDIVREELNLIEYLISTNHFDTTKSVIDILCLNSTLNIYWYFLNPEEQAIHKDTFDYINQLYLGRYIETYGEEPHSFFKNRKPY